MVEAAPEGFNLFLRDSLVPGTFHGQHSQLLSHDVVVEDKTLSPDFRSTL